MTPDFETDGVLDHIDSLSSAEEIFTYLLLPYDQQVLNVARLHVMKRFGAYLGEADLAGTAPEATFLACRALLKRAYGDFVESSPRAEKVFKVFRDEEAKLRARFVGLDALQVVAR
ncbi:MAG: nitrogenase stabilizing/protective protein NifW [Rubrimonas sp.]